MLSIQRNRTLEKMSIRTAVNIAKITGLYLTINSLNGKLRETTKNTSELLTQQIRYLRNKYGK